VTLALERGAGRGTRDDVSARVQRLHDSGETIFDVGEQLRRDPAGDRKPASLRGSMTPRLTRSFPPRSQAG